MSSRELHPTLNGSLSTLRPINNGDIDFVYTISTCVENGFRWRYRGTFPQPACFIEDHSSGTMLQLLVLDRAGKRAGIANVYGENLRDGWAYIGAVSAPNYFDSGVVVDGVATLVDYVFKCWAFRKLYVEAIEYNLDQFAYGLSHVAVEEARLRGHVNFDGKYWDLVTSAIYREQWHDLRRARPRIEAKRANKLSPDEFVGGLAKALDLETRIQIEDLIVEELGWDSLLIVEAIEFVLEERGEEDGPEGLEFKTIQDIYDWYQQ